MPKLYGGHINAFTFDSKIILPISQIVERLEMEIRSRADLTPDIFLWTKVHDDNYHIKIPIGNMVHLYEKSSEYHVYTSYKDLGTPSIKQKKALKLIASLKEFANA